MNKKVLYVTVVLLAISGLAFLTPILAEALSITETVAQIAAFVILGVIGVAIGYIESHHKTEYDIAHRIVQTPYTKYGWYALYIVALFFAEVWVYLTLLS